MDHAKRQKKSETILEVLRNRSKKGLDFARKTVSEEQVICGILREALEYYVSDWKDFTHPGLFSIASEAVGGDPDKNVEAQAAIAMIAAALDIHDDLIDGSRTKHGRPTVFGKYGQGVSLILGDVFLVCGFTLLDETSVSFPKRRRMEISKTYRSLLLKLGNAHALELNLKGKMSIVPNEYMQILEMKAASAEADMRIGAIVGKGTDVEVEALTKYGRNIGMLLTLREEFIDLFEVQELSHRMKEECIPIPLQYCLQDEESKIRLQELLGKRRLTQDNVNELVDIVLEAKSVKGLKKTMGDLVQGSISILSKVKGSETKTILRNLPLATLEDL